MIRTTHVAGCLVLTAALAGCALDSSGLFDGTTGAIDGVGGAGGGATTGQSTTTNPTTSTTTTVTSTTTGSGGAGGATTTSAGGTGGTTTGTGGTGGATTTSTGGTGGATTTGTGGTGGATTTGTGGTGGTTTTAVGTCDPGLACEAALADGWTYVDFSANAADACASGFASSAAVSELPPSAGACACNCGDPSGNPCATLTVQFNALGQSGCEGAKVEMISDGVCHTLPGIQLAKGSRSAVADLSAAKVACAATETKPAAAFGGRACGLVAVSPTCAGGPGVCVPETAGPRCVEKAGAEAACPAGYGTPHVMYPPSDISDQRSCGCECESDAATCSGAKVALYADEGWCNNPNGSAATVPTNPTCTTFNIPSWDRSGYKSAKLTPDKTTCSPKDPAPQVSGKVLVDPTKARTICCAP